MSHAPSGDPAPAADDAGVHADEVEPAEEAGVLDLDASVLDDIQARRPGHRGRLFVADAELEPQHLGADGDRALGDGWDISRLAEDVDDLDRPGNLLQAGIDRLAQDRLAGVFRVDR